MNITYTNDFKTSVVHSYNILPFVLCGCQLNVLLFENKFMSYHLEPGTINYHKSIAIVITTIMSHEIGKNT